MLRPAVFLDRDGVLVRPVMRGGVPYAPLSWDEFAILPGVAEAVAELRAAGYFTAVITNQPEVRRGVLSRELLEQFHQELRQAVPVDAVLVCPHDDRDACKCRKPRPGMILGAAHHHGLDLRRSFLIGDTGRDLGAARSAGLRFFLIDAPYNADIKSGQRVPDLAAAARAILRTSASE